MNQNDMDRYYWRTGQSWRGEDRPFKKKNAGRKLANRTIVFLTAAFAVTVAMLILQR